MQEYIAGCRFHIAYLVTFEKFSGASSVTGCPFSSSATGSKDSVYGAVVDVLDFCYIREKAR